MAISRRSANINVMVEAAEKAGRSLVRDFGEVENLQVSKKGPGDFVSAADLKSEKIIMETLAKARPSYGFFMEEGGVRKGKDENFRWVIDPLDGTTNFLHGIPHWSISIALEKNKEPIAGVVFDPIKNEMFIAEKGTGAYMNSLRLRVSARSELAASLVAFGGARPDAESYAAYMAEVQAVTAHVAGTRRLGSAALDLCYVAAGRFEAYWERDLNAWDVAAGALIIKEAGGFVTDIKGGKDYIYGGSIVAGNQTIQSEMLKKLQKCSAGLKEKVKSAS